MYLITLRFKSLKDKLPIKILQNLSYTVLKTTLYKIYVDPHFQRVYLCMHVNARMRIHHTHTHAHTMYTMSVEC